MAIRNDVFLDKYNFLATETRCILEEYLDHDPKSPEPTTDQVMASLYSYAYDKATGKISYASKMDELFHLFTKLQNRKNHQRRFDNGPDIPKNLEFNLSDPKFVPPDYLKEYLIKMPNEVKPNKEAT
mgnify:CR=1 FL=1